MLGHPRLALVQQAKRMLHRIAHLAFGRAIHGVTRVEGGVDGGFEGGERHRGVLGILLRREAFVGIWAGGVKVAAALSTRRPGLRPGPRTAGVGCERKPSAASPKANPRRMGPGSR